MIQFNWIHILEVDATSRASSQLVCTAVSAFEEEESPHGNFSRKLFSSPAPSRTKKDVFDLQKELNALGQSHNPTNILDLKPWKIHGRETKGRIGLCPPLTSR
ncbi:MAG: hypothetical protein HOI80_02680 [Alphaproteobacteria bacterium]|jgi:hypothetical protein|nr:hypothetical protein [Alphaproteobacteria bacterium]MBT5654390.1 hypothetical protein [Alphaproteobacteria bacterium]